MILSLNEFQALAKAAGRGAGLSWGEAVELGWAARWLGRVGLPGPSWLAGLLPMLRAGQVGPPEGFGAEMRGTAPALCPIRTGLLLSDHTGRLPSQLPVVLHDLAWPGLILPFLAQSCQRLGPLRIEVEGQGGGLTQDGWDASGLSMDHPQVTQVRIAFQAGEPQAQTPCTRVPISQHDHSALTELARRTYAPATAQSRLAGAG